MLGVVELGAWELGSGEFEDAVVIELRPEDAALRVLGPRETTRMLRARQTVRQLNPRDTIREL